MVAETFNFDSEAGDVNNSAPAIVSWDHKNLKHGHERYNHDSKNLATML
jgi:hypothetical protein